MSLDFYDRNGRPYAYSDDGEHIFTFNGKPVAYICEDSIYRFDGQHVGYFESGMGACRNLDSAFEGAHSAICEG